MKTIEEIEIAITQLPETQVEELADWLDVFRQQRAAAPLVEGWLQHARGAALSGVTTLQLMAMTRGDD